MKIAFLTDGYLFDTSTVINGTKVQYFNLSKAFVCRGHEVHYLYLTNSRILGEEKKDGINFHRIRTKKNLLNSLLYSIEYKRLLDKIKPDALYTRGRSIFVYIAAKWSKKNKKIFVWGTNGEDGVEWWKSIKSLINSDRNFFKKLILLPFRYYQDILIHYGMKNAHYIINQTKHQRLRTKSNLNKNGLILPSYFVYIERYKKAKKNQVLWLANLSPKKQPEVFLEIAHRLEHKDWRFVMGGQSKNKEYSKQIFELANNLNVEILGSIAFLKSFEYYSCSKIYVNTSCPDADGLPNAYIQAWLSEVPVISLHHDPNGWLEQKNIGFCTHGDLQSLIQKLEDLMDNPLFLETMGKKAREFATKTFANPAIIDNYLNIFNYLP